MPPLTHAVCSASASERWMHCTAAPRFEEQFPREETSVYAQEGTVAHAVCEVLASKRFHLMTSQKAGLELKRIKKDPLFSDEMLQTAEAYTQYLAEAYMKFSTAPYIAVEVKVDLSDYIPEGFGTCDCLMIGDNTLRIIDYKHGKGVAVSSVENSQMMLYALGALRLFSAVYGDSIEKVTMAIVQPRISDEVTEYTVPVSNLLSWGETVRDRAQKAYTGIGTEFQPGEWCRFCAGRAACRARAEQNTALEDFKDVIVEAATRDPKLSDAELADLLVRGADLVRWYDDLKEYVKVLILSGHTVPGWMVAEGRSNREFSDADKALDALQAAGYAEASLYDRKPKTLSALEKMVGAKEFSEICGPYVVKPAGKPTLTKADPKKVPYGTAENDFAGVGRS